MTERERLWKSVVESLPMDAGCFPPGTVIVYSTEVGPSPFLRQFLEQQRAENKRLSDAADEIAEAKSGAPAE